MAEILDQPQASNHIRNIAIVGASGQVGKHITSALLESSRQTLTAITRPDSTSTFSPGVKVAKVDYSDRAALVSALQGQDALVITLPATATPDAITSLVEAAIEAKVPWILPNEWGGDYTDASINRDTRLGDDKLRVRRLIESQGGNVSAWIAVACGFWYDYSLAAGWSSFGFDITNKKATFFDDGDLSLRYSTLPYTGQAVARLLSLPVSSSSGPSLEDFRNKICRVHAFQLSQKDMFASILRVTGADEKDWDVKYETSEAVYNNGKRILEQEGNWKGWRLMLYSRMFYPSNPVIGADGYSDEVLQLTPLRPGLDETTKWAVEEALRQGD